MGKLIYLAPEIPAFAVAILVCLPWMRPRRYAWLGAGLGYVLFDGLVTIYAPRLPHAHWNWIGKAASLGLALCMVAVLRAPRRETALRWPGGRRQWCWTIAGITGACVFAIGANAGFSDHSRLTVETIAYQATMPGLAEEFCWRGLLFYLLGRAHGHSDGVAAQVPAAVASTLIFSLGHGFSVDYGSAGFAWLPFFYAAVFGGWLAVVRVHTQSLAACVAAHNLANVCGTLASALG